MKDLMKKPLFLLALALSLAAVILALASNNLLISGLAVLIMLLYFTGGKIAFRSKYRMAVLAANIIAGGLSLISRHLELLATTVIISGLFLWLMEFDGSGKRPLWVKLACTALALLLLAAVGLALYRTVGPDDSGYRDFKKYTGLRSKDVLSAEADIGGQSLSLTGEKAQALCDYILSISVLEEDRTYMYDLPENSITFRLEDGGSIRVYISDHVIYYDSDYYVSEGYDLLNGMEFLLN